jgi:hypothetical protein
MVLMLIIALIWIAGSYVANAMADVLVMAFILKCMPTFYGFVNSMFHVDLFVLPKKYEIANFYFSVLLSWGLVGLCLIGLMVGLVYKELLSKLRT